MTDLDIELQRVVAGWLERSGMRARKLGELALEDAGFVAALNCGRSPRLDVADRLLGFMGIAPIGPRFRQEIEAFLIVTRFRPTLLGTRAVGKFLLRAGAENRNGADAREHLPGEDLDARLCQ